MSINDLYRTDESCEINGVPINYEDQVTGEILCWFKCRRPGGRNTEYQKVLNRLLREHRAELQDNDEKDNEQLLNHIHAEVYAEVVILDWGGDIEGLNGSNPAECTKENIVWLFTEDCPDLFADLQNRLSRRSVWRPEDKEAATKNSEAASSTS